MKHTSSESWPKNDVLRYQVFAEKAKVEPVLAHRCGKQCLSMALLIACGIAILGVLTFSVLKIVSSQYYRVKLLNLPLLKTSI